MKNVRVKIVTILGLIFILFYTSNLISGKKIDYKMIYIEKISRYNEDRIVFQQIQLPAIEYNIPSVDNSIATLLVVKDKKMYIFKDGYDSVSSVNSKKVILDMENKLIPDLWDNKIDNIPDFLKITDRRVEIQKRVGEQKIDSSTGKVDYKKNLESKKLINFYKTVRDKLLNQHVDIFKTLMINRKESGLFVTKNPLPRRINDSSSTKFSTTVTGKTIDGKVYYAEDADGDNITETFTVTIVDGFHWGYKSGPNIICIYNNERPEIKSIIKDLVHIAYYGTDEEKSNINKTFLKDEDILDMIEYIYPLNEKEKKMLNK
jgi:hypothetical protein